MKHSIYYYIFGFHGKNEVKYVEQVKCLTNNFQDFYNFKLKQQKVRTTNFFLEILPTLPSEIISNNDIFSFFVRRS